jgi:FkbM family methyltransferase
MTDLLKEQLQFLLSESVPIAEERALTTFDNQLALCKGQLVLYGCGSMGLKVLHCLRMHGIEPLAVADGNPQSWGKSWAGMSILSLAEAVERYGDQAGFLVTIYNPTNSFLEISRQLHMAGCHLVFSLIPLRWKFHQEFLPYLRDDLPHKVLLKQERVLRGYDVFSDNFSRREYVAQVHWRLHADYEQLPMPQTENEYFPDDLFDIGNDWFFVDIGAYDGDTVAAFIKKCYGNYRKIMAIEPDPRNFQKLIAYLNTLPENLKQKIFPFPYAAASRAGQIRFSSGKDEQSSVADEGQIVVEGRTLDELAFSDIPDYIKIDAEGAELDILSGAQRVLNVNRPIVAACAYHFQNHLWEVPLALHSHCYRYNFHIRAHRPDCWDTVCYAVPEERLKNKSRLKNFI